MSETSTVPEIVTLLASLNSQRRHLLGSMDGLSDDDLRRPVLPSGWNCLGLVQHLTRDVEEFWFHGIVAGEPIMLEESSTAWIVAADVPAGSVFDRYRDVTEHANEIIGAANPDAAPLWWPEELFPPGFRYDNVRQIMLHVIAETACHAGHLDIVRELIDGKYWLVLT
jgi:hypothetical protein